MRDGGQLPAILSASDVGMLLDYPSLIAALETMLQAGCEAPQRHHHTVPVPGGSAATLLLMPAWIPGRYLGTKIAHVFPDNGARGLPAVRSVYLLSSGETGELLAIMDGNALTTRRTVAASALAARFLARRDATRLLVVGTGQIARQIAHAHAAVRPIRHVDFWGRDLARARSLAAEFAGPGVTAGVVTDLAKACGEADIVSCCTLSRIPLVHGAWLSPGTHLDLIGGFTPEMREVDDDAVARAMVFVDTAAALSEAGDLVQPIAGGAFAAEQVVADLAAFAAGTHPGRVGEEAITLFKSVGAAFEDLAAAALCWERTLAPSAATASRGGRLARHGSPIS